MSEQTLPADPVTPANWQGNGALAMFDAISDQVASQASFGGPDTKE
ncbi:MAG: hypothetical protein QM714_06760 [Nocardioides sp.]